VLDSQIFQEVLIFFFRFWHSAVITIYRGIFPKNPNTLTERKTIWPKKKYLILQWKHCTDIFQRWIHRLVCFGKVYLKVQCHIIRKRQSISSNNYWIPHEVLFIVHSKEKILFNKQLPIAQNNKTTTSQLVPMNHNHIYSDSVSCEQLKAVHIISKEESHVCPTNPLTNKKNKQQNLMK
jgi:hypothetical protein